MEIAERLMTVGDVARQEHTEASKVRYAIDRYHIEPVQRAGILRLYDQAGVDAIKRALRRIAGGAL